MRKLKRILLLLSLPCVAVVFSMAVYLCAVISYDRNETVEYLTSHSEKKSKGLCACYVRHALIAGGLPAYVKTSACNYPEILPLYGFKEIEDPLVYRKGDIVTFPSVKNHPTDISLCGTANEWVSDFKQRGIIVNSAYKKVDYKIWRHRFG